MTYEWYKTVQYDTPISQGDIILKCKVPVIIDKPDPPFFKISGGIYDVIVMTQACDLANEKTDIVSLCPLKPLTEVIEGLMKQDLLPEESEAYKNFMYKSLSGKQKKRKDTIIQNLKAGFYLDFHVLKEHRDKFKPMLDQDYMSVVLKQTFTIPKKALEKYLLQTRTDRITLLPPYREHLAQAYARNFFRIGLPIDLKIDSNSV